MRIRKKKTKQAKDVAAVAEGQKGEDAFDKRFDEFYDEMEAEIMENVYELIRIHFDTIIVADATQIIPMRERLREFIKEGWKNTR